ncbi:MAG: hypothetical protein II404_06755, partial [Prevotella sp.]|nr:hypothetical protein [Prevotella sp.]
MKRICIYILLLAAMLAGCTRQVENAKKANQLPKLYPDYVGVTIPVGIAPLNFSVQDEDAEAVDVNVKGSKGGTMHVQGEWADFDIDEWHQLLAQNKGGELTYTVCVLKAGQWTQYQDFKITVSNYALDEWGLTYRRIAPGYEVYSHMGIFQRELATFEESAIIDNTQIPGQCVNCHMSNKTNPDHFVFHVRGAHGATMVQMNGKREWLKAK